MRKLLSFLIVASMLLLSSCDFSNQGVTVEETDKFIRITLDNFEGTKKIKIRHDNPGECSMYYKTSITEGGINVSCDAGWLWDKFFLCAASVDADANSGVYIDSSITTVTIILEASQSTSGELLFCFSTGTSPFK